MITRFECTVSRARSAPTSDMLAGQAGDDDYRGFSSVTWGRAPSGPTVEEEERRVTGKRDLEVARKHAHTPSRSNRTINTSPGHNVAFREFRSVPLRCGRLIARHPVLSVSAVGLATCIFVYLSLYCGDSRGVQVRKIVAPTENPQSPPEQQHGPGPQRVRAADIGTSVVIVGARWSFL